MRPPAPIDTPRHLLTLEEPDDVLTVQRARIVLDEAIDEMDLPEGTAAETKKIVKISPRDISP